MNRLILLFSFLYPLITPTPIQAATNQALFLCQQAGPLQETCCTCVSGNTSCATSGENQILGTWTAVGCVNTSQQGISAFFVTWLVSIAGGIALALILYGAFTISTAAANPERLQNGQKIVTQAIAGLFFTLLSVVILQLIGIHLLHLPSFGN